MKKILTALTILIFCLTAAAALEVDVDEIKTDKKIRFINYRGRQAKVETASQIRAIGYRLARGIKRTRPGSRFRYHMKYSVIRAISDREEDKYASDIFYIDREARVDHIKNVRRIISAYLQGMYGYTPEEAGTLTVFLSYYNALHRGDMDYFTSKYKTAVTEKISRANAGIAVRYNLWPGRTAMLIPLTKEAKRGKIAKIDPFVISEKDVRKEIRKDDGNIKTRKRMTALQEEELKKEKKRLSEDRKKAEERKEALEKKKKETEAKKRILDRKKSELEKKKEELKEEKKKADEIKDPEKRRVRKEELKKEENTLKKEEKKIEDERKKTESEEKKNREEEKKVEEAEKKTEEKQKEIKKKEEQVKEEKKEIAEDEKKSPEKTDDLTEKEKDLKKKEEELDRREDRLKEEKADKKIYGLKFYYLKVKKYLEGGHYNNEMYMINAGTRKIEFKSPVTNICGRRYDIFSGGIVVITHQGNHVKGHRLTMLDRKTLKEIKTGKDDIFWRSFIEIRDGHVYVTVREKGKNYLGKFNSDLKLVSRSREEISMDSFITFFEDYIYINRKDMTIMVLKKDDLSFVDVIRP